MGIEFDDLQLLLAGVVGRLSLVLEETESMAFFLFGPDTEGPDVPYLRYYDYDTLLDAYVRDADAAIVTLQLMCFRNLSLPFLRAYAAQAGLTSFVFAGRETRGRVHLIRRAFAVEDLGELDPDGALRWLERMLPPRASIVHVYARPQNSIDAMGIAIVRRRVTHGEYLRTKRMNRQARWAAAKDGRTP